MTKIKICGITNIASAVFAVEEGADALGFVFYPPSTRYLDFAACRSIIKRLPPFVTCVGLFVNANRDLVQQSLDCGINLLQFHGQEDEGFCSSFNTPYIKAIFVAEHNSVQQASNNFISARALLLDAQRGGSAQLFDWSLVPSHAKLPLILAGGLTATNVAQGITQIKPYAVDVSSGVEDKHGNKSINKIKQFIAAVKQVDGR